MRRRLLIVLLGLGTIGGYASGFASLARHHPACPSGGGAGRWRPHTPWTGAPPASALTPEPATSMSPPPAPAAR
ncbi:hypothetical protein MYSTI_05876 [Myxococcus stipitatus DSM 14675]|uniref:Uncharacterized protein n=1 Tax=Myxococcus stipitatus (strain DSM 14675 / JCM 12634 / Mx s8) TaxID=1278073 RepID=L7UHV8_MYXSD|nr:hypothetical protein MYSTI_05876 [Myxococcus stipitatus DSM 14675]